MGYQVANLWVYKSKVSAHKLINKKKLINKHWHFENDDGANKIIK